MKNFNSLDTICASLATLIGIEPPEKAAAPNPILMEYAENKLACVGLYIAQHCCGDFAFSLAVKTVRIR